MTCASCAARVERKLNRMDGVTATVNFATETAKVEFPGTIEVDDLVGTVRATGYTAEPHRRTRKRRHSGRHRRPTSRAEPRRNARCVPG